MSDKANPFFEAAETEELRRTITRLQQQLRRAKAKTDELVDAVIIASKDAVLAQMPAFDIKTLPYRHDNESDKTKVALLHLTDWQGGKRTVSYNSEIMAQRVKNVVAKALKITDLVRHHSNVTKCVVLLGGDMVEGLFNFPTQAFEIDSTIFEQYVNVSALLVNTITTLLAYFEKVEVIAEWGNHGRIGSSRATVPRSDNVDRMCYELARQLLKDIPHLKWNDSAEDIQRVEIGRYRALLIHGDEIGRNGFASKTAIVSHCNRWRSGGYEWPFQDVYVGHYHTHYEESLADGLGAVYGTASTESDNRYASEKLASRGQPSQRLHFIDPEKGIVTAQYKLWA